jgi:hypothetical protein
VTIDAQHWVWNHSRTKGNPRMVLLAVADAVLDLQCETRMGPPECITRLNTSRSTVQAAVDKALQSGELMEIEPAVGSRAALYRLPHAVGYVRPAPGSRGPKSGPVAQEQGPENQAPNSEQGPESRAGSENAKGPNLGPGGPESRALMGPESGPLHQTTPTRSEGLPEGALETVASTSIPDFARPLVDTISRAGYDTLRWNLKHPDWLIVHALIHSHGIERLARYAIEQCSQRQISYGKYFLPGWRDLPPAPAPDPEGVHRLPVRPAPGPAPSPQAARRNASRNVLDQLADQLRAGGTA